MLIKLEDAVGLKYLGCGYGDPELTLVLLFENDAWVYLERQPSGETSAFLELTREDLVSFPPSMKSLGFPEDWDSSLKETHPSLWSILELNEAQEAIEESVREKQDELNKLNVLRTIKRQNPKLFTQVYQEK